MADDNETEMETGFARWAKGKGDRGPAIVDLAREAREAEATLDGAARTAAHLAYAAKCLELDTAIKRAKRNVKAEYAAHGVDYQAARHAIRKHKTVAAHPTLALAQLSCAQLETLAGIVGSARSLAHRRGHDAAKVASQLAARVAAEFRDGASVRMVRDRWRARLTTPKAVPPVTAERVLAARPEDRRAMFDALDVTERDRLQTQVSAIARWLDAIEIEELANNQGAIREAS